MGGAQRAGYEDGLTGEKSCSKDEHCPWDISVLASQNDSLMQIPKREMAAQISAATGFTRVLEMMPKRRLLMILNYHRIGDATQTPYDSGVFSATAEEFDAQLTYLKRHFCIITLEETREIARGGKISGSTVLITFDDGYLDNYTRAFPILRAHNVQATFFLPTAFVGTERLPWWDVIAFIVKQSHKKVIRLRFPEAETFYLDGENTRRVIMRILQLYKGPSMREGERFISELENACETCRPSANSERCFLDWDEAREMQQAGMAFGSHTHTHEILSKLPAEQQSRELYQSREILESQLRTRIDTLSFPVGQKDTFSAETLRLLELMGYRAAFSFYGGLNLPGSVSPFDVRRYGVDGQRFAYFRLQTQLRGSTGSCWF
jgi:peptidoglycan/xylan/chitin deacetylase (PgdA/CDA1 family)